MDPLERELRDTLADDRLSLPVRPDATSLLHAGVRRRRRNRALAAMSAVVVLVAGGATATSFAIRSATTTDRIVPPIGGGSPTPAAKPTVPAPAYDEVPWAPVAYDFSKPPLFPGTAADPSVPWCSADRLTLAQQFQGATGNLLGGITVTNTSSSSCALQGQPTVTMEAADGHVLVASHPEPFYVNQWVRLRPGVAAYATAMWLQEFCRQAPTARIVVVLPHQGGSLTTTMTGAPRCNSQTDPPSAGRLDVDGFVSSTDGPFTPLAGLEANIDKVASSAVPGTTLSYRLQLQSIEAPRVALTPCLPFRERLVDHATQKVLIEEDHFLNCDAAPAEITDPQTPPATYFDMQVTLPPNADPGDYSLSWQSVLKPVSAVYAELVHVTRAVPPCRDGQLTATAGSGGATTGHYGLPVVFRNISSTTCALRGYPGVRLLDSAGRMIPPTPRRGSAFVFTDPGPTTIVLPARDGEASFAIGGEDYDQVHQRECQTAAKIAVYAPDTRNALVVVTPFPACQGITFSAVVAGRLGPRA